MNPAAAVTSPGAASTPAPARWRPSRGRHRLVPVSGLPEDGEATRIDCGNEMDVAEPPQGPGKVVN
jgi:hypothetical protein